MIPGHPILSTVIPPDEKMPVAVAMLITAFIVGYLFISGIKWYCAWRDRHMWGTITKKEV